MFVLRCSDLENVHDSEVNSTKAFSEFASKANMIPETDSLDVCLLVPYLGMPPGLSKSSQMQ